MDAALRRQQIHAGDPHDRASGPATAMIMSRFARFTRLDQVPRGRVIWISGDRPSKVLAAIMLDTSGPAWHIEYIASRAPGAGRRLVRALCRAARQMHVSCTAEVRHDNRRAYEFFQSLGFHFREHGLDSRLGVWRACLC